MSEVMDLIEKLAKAEMELREKERYEELRREGIIDNVTLFVHPKHRTVIEKALYENGIKRIPIIYTGCVEEDTVLATTDKELVKNAKRMIGMYEGEEESHD